MRNRRRIRSTLPSGRGLLLTLLPLCKDSERNQRKGSIIFPNKEPNFQNSYRHLTGSAGTFARVCQSELSPASTASQSLASCLELERSSSPGNSPFRCWESLCFPSPVSSGPKDTQLPLLSPPLPLPQPASEDWEGGLGVRREERRGRPRACRQQAGRNFAV